ncbi:hypothetical protein [Haloferula sp.]|uniref:hypothetical protein n=1 Tax=Haloferula sp. TaxID=2497595 RepID=UPI003C74C633
MKKMIGMVLFLIAGGSLLGDEAVPNPPQKLEWLYTLAVQKGDENFSFSIMKEGWLSFDTWGEGKEFKEVRIELTTEQFDELITKFTECFVDMKDRGAAGADQEFSYCFEQASDTATISKHSGGNPELKALAEELSDLSGRPLPFALEKGAKAAVPK